MPRLFSALEIPPPIAERLSGLRGGLNGARWVEPDNYHITLRFAGDIDEAVAGEFAAALSRIRATGFELTLDGLGSFGNRKPRAVWAGVAGCPALEALQRAHERAALAAGLPPEPRNFHAHVTLARMRGVKAHRVATWLGERGAFLAGPFPVTRFVLFSSRASQGGGPYVVEQSYPLGDGSEG